jgi:hypothetical protein
MDTILWGIISGGLLSLIITSILYGREKDN